MQAHNLTVTTCTIYLENNTLFLTIIIIVSNAECPKTPPTIQPKLLLFTLCALAFGLLFSTTLRFDFFSGYPLPFGLFSSRTLFALFALAFSLLFSTTLRFDFFSGYPLPFGLFSSRTFFALFALAFSLLFSTTLCLGLLAGYSFLFGLLTRSPLGLRLAIAPLATQQMQHILHQGRFDRMAFKRPPIDTREDKAQSRRHRTAINNIGQDRIFRLFVEGKGQLGIGKLRLIRIFASQKQHNPTRKDCLGQDDRKLKTTANALTVDKIAYSGPIKCSRNAIGRSRIFARIADKNVVLHKK